MAATRATGRPVAPAISAAATAARMARACPSIACGTRTRKLWRPPHDPAPQRIAAPRLVPAAPGTHHCRAGDILMVLGPQKRAELEERDQQIAKLIAGGMTTSDAAHSLGLAMHYGQSAKRRLGLTHTRSPVRGLVAQASPCSTAGRATIHAHLRARWSATSLDFWPTAQMQKTKSWSIGSSDFARHQTKSSWQSMGSRRPTMAFRVPWQLAECCSKSTTAVVAVARDSNPASSRPLRELRRLRPHSHWPQPRRDLSP